MVDGINTFNTVNDALNAITDNSQLNRYAIIVMPGVFEEDVIAKSYVDVIGQSRTSSVIKGYTSNGIAISGASNMIVKNLTIESANNGIAVQLLYENSGVYDCNIFANGDSYGIGIDDQAQNTTLENISIRTISRGIGMYINLFDTLIDASTVKVRGIDIRDLMHSGIYVQSYSDKPVTLSDINISGTISSGINTFIGKTEIQNATVKISGKALFLLNNAGIQPTFVICKSCILDSSVYSVDAYSGDLNIDNSNLNGPIRIRSPYPQLVTHVNIANTQISGSIDKDITSILKTVNSHDGNYDPIPNGLY